MGKIYNYVSSKFQETRNWLLKKPALSRSPYQPLGNTLQRFTLEQLPPFTLLQADIMLMDPHLVFGLMIRNGALQQAEVEWSGDEQIIKFVSEQWDRLWHDYGGSLLRTKRYGWMPFEVCYEEITHGAFRGMLGVKELRDFHPRDARLMVKGQEKYGVKFNRLAKSAGVTLPRPASLWTTYDCQFGNHYGRSILNNAYVPFEEKWRDHGAKDVLRVRMMRDGYSGEMVWAPDETMTIPNPITGEMQEFHMMDVFRRAFETKLAGATVVLPMRLGSNGEELCKYEAPHDNGRPDGILEWNERLDGEMWEGLGVVKEVAQAAETGSGYSGRSIAMTTFMGLVTEEFKWILNDVLNDVLIPLAHINFGRDPDIDGRVKPLVETYADDVSGTQVGGGAMGGPASGQGQQGGNWIPQQPPPQQQRPPQSQHPTQFREDDLNPKGADGAEDALKPFLDPATKWIRKTLAELMTEIRADIGIDITRPSLLDDITQRIAALREKVRRGLSESMVASGMQGHYSVAMDAAEYVPPTVIPSASDIGPPSEPPPSPMSPAPEEEPEIRFPAYDKMTEELAASPVFSDSDYRVVAQRAQEGSFAITGELEAATVESIRDTLAKNLAENPSAERFVEDVQSILTNGNGLSENHLHTVFRTNMSASLTKSMNDALNKPLVGDYFPYRAYYATSDLAARPTHRALETLGLDGTNIYNALDPVWKKFEGPWDYGCRCTWSAVSIRQAARRGVQEAKDWLARAKAMADERGGEAFQYYEETKPEFQFVPMPPFEPSPEFRRP